MRDWAKLHVDISKSRSFASLVNEDPRAGVLFLMMLPRADVLGIVDAHPVIFRGEVCPLLEISEEEIERFLDLIQDHEMILLYEDGRGSRWAWVRSWGKYQDVRWTHVGVPNRPLPEGWTAPEGLQKHLREKPDNAVSMAVEELCSNYVTTTVPTTELVGAPCERAQDVDVDVDVEGDSEKEGAQNDNALPVDQTNEQPDQKLIRECYEAYTKSPMLKGESRRGYAGLRTLIGEVGHELAEDWRDHVRDLNGSQVKRGAKAWPNFSKTFRADMNQPWNWKDDIDPPHQEDLHAGYPRASEAQ